MIALASLPPWNEGVHVGRPSDRIGGECRVRSNPRAASSPRGLLLIDEARLLISKIRGNQELAPLPRVGKRVAVGRCRSSAEAGLWRRPDPRIANLPRRRSLVENQPGLLFSARRRAAGGRPRASTIPLRSPAESASRDASSAIGGRPERHCWRRHALRPGEGNLSG